MASRAKQVIKKFRLLQKLVAFIGLPTLLISIGILIATVFIIGTIAMFLNLGNSQNQDAEVVGLYDPQMIKIAAKAMQADPSDDFIKNLQEVIQNESGGDPSVIQQVQDINSGGNEAAGLLQYTPGTFAYYALQDHTDRLSALDQLLAFFNNSKWNTSIGMTNILGTQKMEWLNSGPQGTPRFKTVPGQIDLSGLNDSVTTANYKLNTAGNTYPIGQCTWFAKARSGWAGNGWGNGCQWGTSAAAAGFLVNNKPETGALVVFAAGQMVGNWRADAICGHVAYVESYNASTGTIKISQGGPGFATPTGPNYQTLSNLSAYVYIHNK